MDENDGYFGGDGNQTGAKFDRKKKSGGFQSMGFAWQILKAILNSGYKQPTPIQRKAIPEILLGKDVVAMARTGSGKTAAFLLPMLQRLQERTNSTPGSSNGPRALIMSPTRELALQTFKFTKTFAKYTDFKAAVILGGDKIEDQFETMHQNPDIIIATPGRFLHICIEMNLKLSSIEYVVFDEADRLFEMGFKEQLNEILHKLPSENRQTLLFSATMPQSLVEFARAGLQNPVLIRLDVESKLSDKLKLAFFQCRIEDKLAILVYLLNNVIKAVKNPSDTQEMEGKQRLEQTLIFVATKHHVEFLKSLLDTLGFNASYAYSSLDQTARQINIAKFQAKKTAIMIVTDVAARGIDIPMLDNVINFNFPAKAKLFVHRVGRVARAGQYGSSYSLVTNDELPYMHELHEFLTKQIRFASDDMKPDDWNEVYGSVPQAIVDIEKDSLKYLIETKVELQSAFQVQENAYKQYLKSRPLASTSSVRAAKNIRLLHPVLGVHPIFKNNQDYKDSAQSETNLLDKLKSFVTKSTIFEVNKTSVSQPSALIMRKKRLHHDKVVQRYKSKEFNEENISLFQKNMYSVMTDAFRTEDDDNEENNENADFDHDKSLMFNDQELIIKVSNSNSAENDTESSKKALKRKKQQEIIDKEHFIPYKPKNFNQEKALGINSNFNKDINGASLDMMGDDADEIRRNMQKMKWDRKKKKYVTVQSTLEKTKKIKTESGNYINASYKSDLYAKWLKKNKGPDGNNDDDDDDEIKDRKNKKFFGSEKKYFGSHKFKTTGKPGIKRFKTGGKETESNGRKSRRSNQEPFGDKKRKFSQENKSSGNKRFKGSDDASNSNGKKRFNVGLKNKDQIIKERGRKAKIQKFQNRKKAKGGSAGGRGKKSSSFRSKK